MRVYIYIHIYIYIYITIQFKWDYQNKKLYIYIYIYIYIIIYNRQEGRDSGDLGDSWDLGDSGDLLCSPWLRATKHRENKAQNPKAINNWQNHWTSVKIGQQLKNTSKQHRSIGQYHSNPLVKSTQNKHKSINQSRSLGSTCQKHTQPTKIDQSVKITRIHWSRSLKSTQFNTHLTLKIGIQSYKTQIHQDKNDQKQPELVFKATKLNSSKLKTN